MLTKEDLSQIRGVVSEVVEPAILASEKRVITTIIHSVGEMIEQNILPQFDEIHEEIGELKQDVSVLKQDVGVLKQDVSVLKQDVGVLKQDVSVLKQDVGVLKQDVSVLKQDVSEIKTDMRSMNAKMVTKGGLEDRLTDFRLTLSNART